MNSVTELFGRRTVIGDDWTRIIREQRCPFLERRCYKVRKSEPDTSIGTCTVLYGKSSVPVLICPARLIHRGQVFTDCLHLLTTHEPGNELHLVSEVRIPGGTVDYFLVSVRQNRVKDFVGIELQAVDTTGTVWPERQRLLRDLGVRRSDESETSNKRFGVNWKMTAKTTLVQMHHKIQTFEHVNKRLVLVTQDRLLHYMMREFRFDHLANPSMSGDSMHFHAYAMEDSQSDLYRLVLAERFSTDADGIATCLGLQASRRVRLEEIFTLLERRIGTSTAFMPVRAHP